MRCWSWPNCICHTKLVEFRSQIDDWIVNPVPPETIFDALRMIHVYLSCIKRWCHDSDFRLAATIELMKPFWKKHKEHL